MVIAPIIFCTVVSGISHIQDASKVGASASSAGLFRDRFTFALALACDGNLIQIGHGSRRKTIRRWPRMRRPLPITPSRRKPRSRSISSSTSSGQRGRRAGARDILQVLLLDPVRLRADGDGQRANRLRDLVDDTAHAVFGVIASS